MGNHMCVLCSADQAYETALPTSSEVRFLSQFEKKLADIEEGPEGEVIFLAPGDTPSVR